jgi:hypothetical protein
MVGGRILAKKTSQNVDRRAVGCNLVVLERAAAAPPQSGYKILRHFKAPPDEQLKVLSVLV